jgi:hypothetical protein
MGRRTVCALGGGELRVEHIGSTAVPGLAATVSRAWAEHRLRDGQGGELYPEGNLNLAAIRDPAGNLFGLWQAAAG